MDQSKLVLRVHKVQQYFPKKNQPIKNSVNGTTVQCRFYYITESKLALTADRIQFYFGLEIVKLKSTILN